MRKQTWTVPALRISNRPKVYVYGPVPWPHVEPEVVALDAKELSSIVDENKETIEYLYVTVGAEDPLPHRLRPQMTIRELIRLICTINQSLEV